MAPDMSKWDVDPVIFCLKMGQLSLQLSFAKT